MSAKLKVFIHRENDVSLKITTLEDHPVDQKRLMDAIELCGGKRFRNIPGGFIVEMPFPVAADYLAQLLAVSRVLNVVTGG